MGWEIRRRQRFYYRKTRGPDGHVRSVYCGGGERGEAAAREDEARRSTTELADIRHEKKEGSADFGIKSKDELAQLNAKRETTPVGVNGSEFVQVRTKKGKLIFENGEVNHLFAKQDPTVVEARVNAGAYMWQRYQKLGAVQVERTTAPPNENLQAAMFRYAHPEWWALLQSLTVESSPDDLRWAALVRVAWSAVPIPVLGNSPSVEFELRRG